MIKNFPLLLELRWPLSQAVQSTTVEDCVSCIHLKNTKSVQQQHLIVRVLFKRLKFLPVLLFSQILHCFF